MLRVNILHSRSACMHIQVPHTQCAAIYVRQLPFNQQAVGVAHHMEPSCSNSPTLNAQQCTAVRNSCLFSRDTAFLLHVPLVHSPAFPNMALSKYEYVKQFELDDKLLPGCWVVIRLDGKGFTKFCNAHSFKKPNDKRGLDLMDAAAKEVMAAFPDIRLGFGESDEYSFVLHKDTQLYERRASKLVSTITSCFSASYVRLWPAHLPGVELAETPMFDGRAVCYPTEAILRDYLSWRQVDTHVNNQYNTCFWALVQSGTTPAEAQARLKGTDAAAKNELLFTQFGINYAHLPEQFRKGSVVVRQKVAVVKKLAADGTPVERVQSQLVVLHCDIIQQSFWDAHPHILA